jgi:hypothetical protein
MLASSTHYNEEDLIGKCEMSWELGAGSMRAICVWDWSVADLPMGLVSPQSRSFGIKDLAIRSFQVFEE